MKKLKTILFAITILLLNSAISFAHENPVAPHGGKIEEAGFYHIEFLKKDNKVYFYLLDNNVKSFSNTSITGSVLMQFKDGNSKTITLTPAGTDGFIANDAQAIDFSKAIVTFRIKEKTTSAKFNNTNNTAAVAKYVCPMHKEITSNKNGKCSICGMSLKKM